MQGEIQAGQLVEISTTEVLSAAKDPPAWRVHQITDWYGEMLGDINTKLENNGHVRIPKADRELQWVKRHLNSGQQMPVT